MSPTWDAAETPQTAPITPLGWLRVALRAPVLAIVTFGGLALHLALRVVERPIFGTDRPVTPWITQGVCRIALLIVGLRLTTQGARLQGQGAVVANHSSWLDIFVLNAADRIYFVSKDEVAGWPGIGWLARATGTMFIRRDPREARRQRDQMTARLRAGHRLLFFPEGTSTDGMRVLPFKTTLFAAFFMDGLPADFRVQPVTVVYDAPKGADRRFYGWWGEMDFGSHLLTTLAASGRGAVIVTYHAPLSIAEHADRKTLALAAERQVRAALQDARG